tara:strand:+ start:9039 stop:9551 length:513 start_codon:yes stop_codon:yes gene_type:complete
MKGSQRARNITVTDKLTLGVNAVVRIKKSGNEGYDTLLPKSANQGVLTTTKSVAANESGTHFVLNTATAFVTTLPAPAAGLEYWFHIGATVPTTTHTVVTNASANIIVGNICTPEDAAGSVPVVQDADTISFVANLAVHGDFAHVWTDGTNWYLDGMCSVEDGMTTTQVS